MENAHPSKRFGLSGNRIGKIRTACFGDACTWSPASKQGQALNVAEWLRVCGQS